jgi:hypothetical protein
MTRLVQPGSILAMTRSLLAPIIFAVLAALLAAPSPPSGAAQAAEDARNIRFALLEANESGLEARVKLIDLDGQVRVVVAIRGVSEGEYLPHIHSGSCDEYSGTPVFPLSLFAAGERSRTTVDISYDDLLSGGYLVDIHPVATSVDELFDPATALVCGQIPGQNITPEPAPPTKPEIDVIKGPNAGVGPIPDRYSSTILASVLAAVAVAMVCSGLDLRRRAMLSIAQRRLIRLTGRPL